MITFEQDYRNGKSVAAYDPQDRLIGIPCGFVRFSHGVSWATDAVVASDWTGSWPYRHLYGKVEEDGTDLICDGWRFTQGRCAMKGLFKRGTASILKKLTGRRFTGGSRANFARIGQPETLIRSVISESKGTRLPRS